MLEGKSRGIKNVGFGWENAVRAVLITEKVYPIKQNFRGFHVWKSFKISKPSVELHLKAGRTPFDVNFVYLKTGKRFRVVLKYRTDLYLKTGQNCT
jgi:hypothetical protein